MNKLIGERPASDGGPTVYRLWAVPSHTTEEFWAAILDEEGTQALVDRLKQAPNCDCVICRAAVKELEKRRLVRPSDRPIHDDLVKPVETPESALLRPARSE